MPLLYHLLPQIDAIFDLFLSYITKWSSIRIKALLLPIYLLLLPHSHRQICLDKAVDGTVEDGLSIVGFVFGAGVFNEGIGMKHIVADLRTPASGLTSAEVSQTGGLLLVLELSKARAQDSESRLTVLNLAALVLNRNDDTSRQMGNAHCRVGRINALPTLATAAVDVDPEVFVLKLHLLGLSDFWHHLHQSEACLAQMVSIEWAEPDQAVHAMLAGAAGHRHTPPWRLYVAL